MPLQRLALTFQTVSTGLPCVNHQLTIYPAGETAPSRLYHDQAGFKLLSNKGQVRTDSNGQINVWTEEKPLFEVSVRTPSGVTVLDRVQVFAQGPIDVQSQVQFSSAEVDILRGFLGGGGGGGGSVVSVNGRAGIVTLTKADVGLTNADNTSDVNKPISSATQTALDAKLTAALVSGFALTLLDDANAAAMRTTLGLGTAALSASTDFATSAHTHLIAGITGLQAALDAKHVGVQFQDEGSNLGAAGSVDTVNFIGSGVTANRAGNSITVNVSGGGGAGELITISGTLGEASTLTATLTGGFATGFQWYRNGSAIGGATNIDGTGTISTYLQVAGDVGSILSVRAVGFVPMRIAGTVPGGAPDSRPRFGLGSATSWSTNPAGLLAGMTVIPGSSNNGRAGTFSLLTTAGNFGWVAVVASITTGGLSVFDGIGFGGWNGAGLPGNNTGASPDPCISSITYNDGTVTWRLFRQDFIHANPVASNYTIS